MFACSRSRYLSASQTMFVRCAHDVCLRRCLPFGRHWIMLSLRGAARRSNLLQGASNGRWGAGVGCDHCSCSQVGSPFRGIAAPQTKRLAMTEPVFAPRLFTPLSALRPPHPSFAPCIFSFRIPKSVTALHALSICFFYPIHLSYHEPKSPSRSPRCNSLLPFPNCMI